MVLDELSALIALSSIPYLGPVKIKQLIASFGSALNVLAADLKEIEERSGFGNKILDGLKNWQDNPKWKEELKLIQTYGISLIPYTSPKYPKSLLELHDCPLILYLLGDLKPEDEKSIAIIGTRQAGIYGLEMAEKFSEDLSLQGFTIISGLARGIDTAAHKAALKNGRTIGVIGSGLLSIYPKENLKLAEAISKNGALISEFPLLTPPEKQNFPKRNRIISGLSLGALLIEAPLKSGSMITMELAKKQNKKLFVIPGRIDDENFQGNHSLIKTREAEVAENADDICKILHYFGYINSINPLKSVQKKEFPELPKEEADFLHKLPAQEFSIEEAILKSEFAPSKLNALLMSLMLKGAIREYPGKMYKKIGRK